MLNLNHKYCFGLLLFIYLCFGSIVMAQDTLYAKLKYNLVSHNLNICTNITSEDTVIKLSVQLQNNEGYMVKKIEYDCTLPNGKIFEKSLRKNLRENILLTLDSYLNSTNRPILKRDIRRHLKTVKKLVKSNNSFTGNLVRKVNM